METQLVARWVGELPSQSESVRVSQSHSESVRDRVSLQIRQPVNEESVLVVNFPFFLYHILERYMHILKGSGSAAPLSP